MPSTSGRNLHVVSASNAQASAKRLRLRVLIADDDRDTATMLAMVLRDEGDEVHTTLRGDEVLEACRLLRPDVVIVDINMPGMSGYAIARELRERHGTLAPLLIAISGVWTRTSDRLVGTVVGFDHYLLKPCEPKEVLRLMEPLRSGSSDADSAP
ncbi:MAG TPA: response regulator [Burkholderiales bacterium]|nr:response regulator [Burkholderiales bacterium]